MRNLLFATGLAVVLSTAVNAVAEGGVTIQDKTGKLGLSITGGKVHVLDLKIKTHEESR